METEPAIGIAKIFRSFQGEGIYSGMPMLFIRTAGCSVGCPGCDTNYKLTQRLSISDLRHRVQQSEEQFVWVTGGEPTDWKNLDMILDFDETKKFVLATSGIRAATKWETYCSPHKPKQPQLQRHKQINLVPLLNGLSDEECLWYIESWEYDFCFLTPLDGKGRKQSLDICQRLIRAFPGRCRLGVQAHKVWELE